MKSTTLALIVLCLLPCLYTFSQENIGYQTPPEEILELVDIQRPPNVLMDEGNNWMILLYRNTYKSIAELSEEELRLGGLRINPKTNIGSRVTYYNKIELKNMSEGQAVEEISGLPETLKLANISWSPDQKKVAFTNTVESGVELWVLDIEGHQVTKLSAANINSNMRTAVSWFKDGQSILAKVIPDSKQPLIDTKIAVPTGPTVSTNNGKKAQNRTYQDLLKNKNDEHNFEQLALSKLVKFNLDGTQQEWMETAMYNRIDFSPDGEYVFISTLEKPFSYLVPYYRFPSTENIYTKEGELVETLAEIPLIEDLPKGFMAVREGRRNFAWRTDKAATITFAEALDEGDPSKEVVHRDEIFELSAPFNGNAKSLIKTKNRISYLEWGSDNVAVAHDYWFTNRNTKSYLFNPTDAKQEPVVLSDRNYQDAYSDPGDLISKRNAYGEYVLEMHDDNIFLIGDGYSAEGQFPFVDKINIKTQDKKRVYQSTYTDKLEDIQKYDPAENKLMVRIESPKEFPNYYTKDLSADAQKQLTAFENPFKSIQDVQKQVIKYTREDGVELSGTLYLPAGYDTLKKEKLPMILWAYPREYKDKSSASQNTQNPNEFTYVGYGSMIYWVTRGYAVLDDAAFPIVGEGDEEPNDSFRKQLVANGKAAIDAVDALGYIDRRRVGVGGHSYGAFMVANLLSHCDLFAAGIARSGAYNRTLTPFGFQREERSYWEAPEVYYTMSPFMHADKMKYPLLLTHGAADNNSGTYPMQSERYFNALKGLGANVRLVVFPKESHGYRSKETIYHLLWEQDQWLEKHVKNRPIERS